MDSDPADRAEKQRSIFEDRNIKKKGETNNPIWGRTNRAGATQDTHDRCSADRQKTPIDIRKRTRRRNAIGSSKPIGQIDQRAPETVLYNIGPRRGAFFTLPARGGALPNLISSKSKALRASSNSSAPDWNPDVVFCAIRRAFLAAALTLFDGGDSRNGALSPT